MDIDLYFAAILISFGAAASAFMQLWIKNKEINNARPLLAVSLSRQNDDLDLVINNAGSGAATGITVSVRGAFGGVRIYKVDAIGAGSTAEVKSSCPRTGWVELTLHYSDSSRRRFESRRRLEAVDEQPFRLVESAESISERPRLLDSLRGR
jgi:hypothetical protein